MSELKKGVWVVKRENKKENFEINSQINERRLLK